MGIYFIMGFHLVVEEREVQRGGRVTIPKEIRDKFGLVEGTVVRISVKGNVIEIEPPSMLHNLLGLVKTDNPSDDPKREAREYLKGKLLEEVE
jgi:AbrB family looped-hinge helix DNA binding protein